MSNGCTSEGGKSMRDDPASARDTPAIETLRQMSEPSSAHRPNAESLDQIAAAARACRVCAVHLPLGPRPVFRVSTTARLLIAGQAPGTKVHATGVPWNDPSGDRLR